MGFAAGVVDVVGVNVVTAVVAADTMAYAVATTVVATAVFVVLLVAFAATGDH